MTVQGLSIGLDAHQFRAFDRQAIEAEFAVPAHWEATSMTAFGVADHLPGEIRAAGTSRERADRDDIVWARGRARAGIGPGSAPRAAAATGGIFNDLLGLDPS